MIVVSLVILLMAMVLVILVSVLLVRRYFTRKTEIDRVLFPEVRYLLIQKKLLIIVLFLNRNLCVMRIM